MWGAIEGPANYHKMAPKFARALTNPTGGPSIQLRSDKGGSTFKFTLTQCFVRKGEMGSYLGQ
jgi:hypothetical protein